MSYIARSHLKGKEKERKKWKRKRKEKKKNRRKKKIVYGWIDSIIEAIDIGTKVLTAFNLI